MRLTSKSLLLGIILSALLASSVLGGSLDHNFQQGNELYSNGEFHQAAAEYEMVLQAGYQSPELYFNLGNAYFRDGNLGLAIKNYIKARRLSPRDDDIKANLEFARKYAIDKIELNEQTIILDYISDFFNSFSLTEISWLTAGLYLILIASLFAGVLYKWIPMPTPLLTVIIVFFVIGATFPGVKLDRDVLNRNGVITTDQIDIKNGPGDDYKTQFTAHAGLVFNIEREESGYYLVNFENRLKGWIDKSAVAEI